MRCHICKIEGVKLKTCSRCHKTVYCSEACQSKDWKVHKKSDCIVRGNEVLRKAEKMLKNNPMMARIQTMEDAAWAQRAREAGKGPYQECDGCMLEYGEDDVGPPFKTCQTCDYTICKTCSDENTIWGTPRFDRQPHTCRCRKANFGVPYCFYDPVFFHGDGHRFDKTYHGDRHPKMETRKYPESAFEENEKACKNCGMMARCLKKEHLRDALAGM